MVDVLYRQDQGVENLHSKHWWNYAGILSFGALVAETASGGICGVASPTRQDGKENRERAEEAAVAGK
jgi:hypothetical protein